MESVKVKTIIDQQLSFEQVPQAIQKLKTGRARGKIVVNIARETYKKVSTEVCGILLWHGAPKF